jgi:hypothetical protein
MPTLFIKLLAAETHPVYPDREEVNQRAPGSLVGNRRPCVFREGLAFRSIPFPQMAPARCSCRRDTGEKGWAGR